MLEAFDPVGAVAGARNELAEELLGDLRRLDAQLAELKKRLAAVVRRRAPPSTEVFGVGPVVAGHRDRRRPATWAASPTRTTSPPTTALPR